MLYDVCCTMKEMYPLKLDNYMSICTLTLKPYSDLFILMLQHLLEHYFSLMGVQTMLFFCVYCCFVRIFLISQGAECFVAYKRSTKHSTFCSSNTVRSLQFFISKQRSFTMLRSLRSLPVLLFSSKLYHMDYALKTRMQWSTLG